MKSARRLPPCVAELSEPTSSERLGESSTTFAKTDCRLPGQSIDLEILSGGDDIGKDLDVGADVGRRLDYPKYTESEQALNDQPNRPIGHTNRLVYLDPGAHFVEIGAVRGLDRGVTLGYHADKLSGVRVLFEQPNRGLSTYGKRQDGMWKYGSVSQGEDRNRPMDSFWSWRFLLFGCHLFSSVFRPTGA